MVWVIFWRRNSFESKNDLIIIINKNNFSTFGFQDGYSLKNEAHRRPLSRVHFGLQYLASNWGQMWMESGNQCSVPIKNTGFSKKFVLGCYASTRSRIGAGSRFENPMLRRVLFWVPIEIGPFRVPSQFAIFDHQFLQIENVASQDFCWLKILATFR